MWEIAYKGLAIIGAAFLLAGGSGLLLCLVTWPMWKDDEDTIAACRGEHETHKQEEKER